MNKELVTSIFHLGGSITKMGMIYKSVECKWKLISHTLTGFIWVLSHFNPSNGSKLSIVLKVEMKSLMVQKGNSNRNLFSQKLFGARKIPFVIGCLFSIVAMLLLEFCPILKNSNPIFLKILLTDIPKGRHTYFSLSHPQQDCIFPLFKILLL